MGCVLSYWTLLWLQYFGLNGWKFIKVVICLRQGWSVLLLSNHNELNP